MKKYTQKELKNLVSLNKAEDITHYSFEQADNLHKAHYLETIGLSTGTYGMNGALLKDENGTLYVISARNSTLFQLV